MVTKFTKDLIFKQQIIGGKGCNLVNLHYQNYNVPKAYLITTKGFDFFVKINNLTSIVKDLKSQKNIKKLSEIGEIIRKKIFSGEIPQPLLRDILVEYKNHGFSLVSVRSSVNVEDGMQFSFAGQFESYLNIDVKSLKTAIKKCWASTYSKRVILYCFHNNIHPAKLKPAVIIQQMIDICKGGVIYSQNLTSGCANELLIEACQGHLEKLVDGVTSPAKYLINKQNLSLIKSSKNGHLKDLLTQKELFDLSQIAVKIEEFYGCPQDIEWGIQNDKIYILQSRPLTISRKYYDE